MANVKLLPSISAPVNVPVFTMSSFVATANVVAVGASFTALTVMLTAAVAEFNVPSFTLNVKLSLPLKFAAGV